MPQTDALVPVYISLATLLSGVQNLRAHGSPPELDRLAWAGRSGSDQSALLSAFKFLGLIDAKGKTEESLRRLVAAPEGSPEEKATLSQILRERYATVFQLDLKTATPNQLSDAIGSD